MGFLFTKLFYPNVLYDNPNQKVQIGIVEFPSVVAPEIKSNASEENPKFSGKAPHHAPSKPSKPQKTQLTREFITLDEVVDLLSH
jgi:hypothetical protein